MPTDINQKIEDILIEVGFDQSEYDLDKTVEEIIDLLGLADIRGHAEKTSAATSQPVRKGSIGGSMWK